MYDAGVDDDIVLAKNMRSGERFNTSSDVVSDQTWLASSQSLNLTVSFVEQCYMPNFNFFIVISVIQVHNCWVNVYLHPVSAHILSN